MKRMSSRGRHWLRFDQSETTQQLFIFTQSLFICHQPRSQPAVGAAAAVPRRAADGASGAGLAAVPRGQHGLCPHFADVHGKTSGVGRGWLIRSSAWLNTNLDSCLLFVCLFCQGEKIKERLTPILNLLTESCRAHRETRKYIRKYVRTSTRMKSLAAHFVSVA